ncbi:flavodoxin family protein [Eggerthellaceae bacterium zg-893]|nr:flavodoxin family protein [Eggerthellaceae bacterium zg-893]
MRRLVLCGSPRARGRAAALALRVVEAYEQAGDEVGLVLLAEAVIAPCTGCNACKHNAATPLRDDLYCVIADSMARIRRQLNDCDALTVVSPVYFSGAPAQLKAFYDRLQPYYWSKYAKSTKRPADLFVVGEGGDPHGFEPLVSETRSALAVAGFRLERVHDWVGLVHEDGRLDDDRPVLEGGRTAAASDYCNETPSGLHPTYLRGGREAHHG